MSQYIVLAPILHTETATPRGVKVDVKSEEPLDTLVYLCYWVSWLTEHNSEISKLSRFHTQKNKTRCVSYRLTVAVGTEENPLDALLGRSLCLIYGRIEGRKTKRALFCVVKNEKFGDVNLIHLWYTYIADVDIALWIPSMGYKSFIVCSWGVLMWLSHHLMDK